MRDRNIEESLRNQVQDIMNDDRRPKKPKARRKAKKKKPHFIIRIFGFILSALFVGIFILVGTEAGRNILYRSLSKFIHENIEFENEDPDNKAIEEEVKPKQDELVTNFLIFGIEEIGGARNTDAMLIATINTRDRTVKLTSLLRDTYVEIPGYSNNKLNWAYARGGVDLLIDTIELNHKIQIDGYASVTFDSFEAIIDTLGGVTIELGEKEARYLNRTNYISNKANRNVSPGPNHLNGNQAMGYVRIRGVETLGGVRDDYGRVLRQQRVLKAIFESAISPKNLIQIVPKSKEILSHVTTNLTQKQMEESMRAVVENKITTMETFRIPVDNTFESPKRYNGIGYPLLLDWETNRIELYKFIFDYTEEEAVQAIASFG